MRSLRLVLVAVSLIVSGTAWAKKPPAPAPQALPTCEEAFHNLWAAKAQYGGEGPFSTAVAQLLTPHSEPACGSEYLGALPGTALELYQPARQNLFQALENYSTQQQSTSTTSSTSSVTPVSKVSGSSSIAEEFSGVNVNSGTSALTFQFAPGTVLSTLEGQSVIVPCEPAMRLSRHCLGGGWNEFAERLTFSLTANTSTASQSIKGTASGGASGTSSPATLVNAGSTEPSFGGLGAKGVILRQSTAKAPKGKTPVSAYKRLSESSADLGQKLKTNCPAFGAAVREAAEKIAVQDSDAAFVATLREQYAPLGEALSGCLKANPAVETAVQKYLAAYLVVVTDTQADLDSAQTPMLGAEYDFNQPPNQPAYSSVKANFSWNLVKSKAAKKGDSAPNESQTGAGQLASAAAENAVTLGQSAPPATAAARAAAAAKAAGQSKTAKKAAAENTPPLSVSTSVSLDLYNGKPPSGVPGTDRLRDVQAGAEIDWITPTSKIPKLGSLMGDSTLAGSYYYQDQTSPGIVTGPPSGITIVGLPSTAKTVYAAKGPINLGQIRWGLGTGSNVSFPICFTYSNRSELITHPIKGIQFGLSYNLTALFAKGSTSGGGAGAAGKGGGD